jgi:hypothetical protein
MSCMPLIFYALVSRRWISMGDQGIIHHRSRGRALRAQGQGQRWVVSPEGRVIRRPKTETLDLMNLIAPVYDEVEDDRRAS